MKIFVDTNILVNYLEDQTVYGSMLDDSKAIETILNHGYDMFSTASAATDIAYLLARDLREAKRNTGSVFNGFSNRQIAKFVRTQMIDLMNIVGLLTVTELDVRIALSSDWKDFEDALQYIVSLRYGMDMVVTWNKKDFRSSDIPVYTPREFITTIN